MLQMQRAFMCLTVTSAELFRAPLRTVCRPQQKEDLTFFGGDSERWPLKVIMQETLLDDQLTGMIDGVRNRSHA